MLAHTDPVASIIPAMSLDSPSDNAMTALSRLALGPVNTDYYLEVFERFDSTGRTTTTWNWAACLCTLNWMLFRQLWGAALVYVAAAQGLALILWGIGRSFLQWPMGVELGVLGAVAVLAFAVPGLYGNAILYADTRKRVARALAASRTVTEACALLEKQASSRTRLRMVVLANLLLGAAALLAYLVLGPSGVKPLALEPAVTVAQATAAASAASATQALQSTPVPVTDTPPAAAQRPTEETATGQAAAALAAPPSPPAAPDSQPTTPPPPEPPTAPLAVATPATPPPSAQALPASAAAPAPKASTTTNAPSRRDAASRAVSTSKTKAAPSAAAVDAQPQPTVGKAPGFYINVGLFAEEANARKTQARLLNEGLPAFRQELNNSKGRRIRVRVGPYATRAQADAAAQTIRAMSLDAIVFKQ